MKQKSCSSEAKKSLKIICPRKKRQINDNVALNGTYGEVSEVCRIVRLSNKLPKGYRNFQTVLTNQPVKPFLKFKCPYHILEPNKTLYTFLNAIKEVVVENSYWDYKNDFEVFAVSEHKSNGIHEFMITISNTHEHRTTHFLKNRKFAALFASQVQNIVPKDLADMMDFNVYKFGAHLYFVDNGEVGGSVWEKTLCFNQHSNLQYAIEYIPFPSEEIEMYEPQTSVEDFDIKKEIASNSTIEIIESMAKILHPSIVTATTNFVNGYYSFIYNDPNEICFASRTVHKPTGFSAFIQSGVVKFTCANANCDDDNDKKRVLCIQYEENDPKLFNLIKNATSESRMGASKLANYICRDTLKVTVNAYYILRDGLWIESTVNAAQYYLQQVLTNLFYGFLNAHADRENQVCIIDQVVKQNCLSLLNQLQNFTGLATILQGINLKDDSFENVKNSHPGILAFQNGLLSLKTNELRAYESDDNLTMPFLEYAWDEFADYSEWDCYVKEITSSIHGESPADHAFIKKFTGYMVDGNPTEKVMLYLFGKSGGNGKSLFIGCILEAMGSYAECLNTLIFEPTKNGKPNPFLCMLKGKRGALLAEIPENLELGDSQFKTLLGKDKVTTRDLYKASESFVPIFTVIIAGNCIPKVNFDDLATDKRILTMPFDIEFTNNVNPNNPLQKIRDESLEEKFKSKKGKQGIMKWIAEGHRDFLAHPYFEDTPRMKQLKQKFRDEN